MAKSENPHTSENVPSWSNDESSDRPVKNRAKPVNDAASEPTRQERLRAIAEDAERRLKGSMKLLS